MTLTNINQFIKNHYILFPQINYISLITHYRVKTKINMLITEINLSHVSC